MFKSKRLLSLLFSMPLSLVLSLYSYAAGDLNTECFSYKVSGGDTLYKVSKDYNIPVDKLKEFNKLSDDSLYPGMNLDIPYGKYLVKSGDTLYSIAKNHRMTLQFLREVNDKWNNNIKPGQEFLVLEKESILANPKCNTSFLALSQHKLNKTEDIDILARLINAEAGDESYNAQVAVGAVVLNRVADSRFPSNIHDVIYQVYNGHYQFSPVENGFIKRSATEESKNAAIEALSGSDPTHGAVYFYDDSSKSEWMRSKPVAAKIGRMIYTY